jgi:hypothetical protein
MFNAGVSPPYSASSAQRLRAALAISSLISSALLVSQSAFAEPSASDRATARSLAGEGYAALKVKDYQTAEDRFRRADELVHAPTLVVDHARALVGLGHFGEAYEAYDSVLKETVPDNAPAVWKGAVKHAQQEIEAIKPRVAWLRVNVQGPQDPDVEIDGQPLPVSALGQERPTNPGERSFVVSAKGFITKTVTIVLNEGARQTLELELLPEPKPAPVVILAPPIVPSPRDQELEAREERNRTSTYIAFTVAGVGVATGATAGILWLKSRSDIKSSCGSLKCTWTTPNELDRETSDKRRYDTLGIISGIGFGVGLAGAVTGIALLSTEPSTKADSGPQKAKLEPYLFPTSLGVRGTF